MARFGFNSLRVVIIAVPFTLFVASWAGFALIRLPIRVQKVMIWLSLAALLAPPTALWLARFPLFKALGRVDTLFPLIAPALIGGSPFFVLLFYWSFRRLPPDLFEAAILDGASSWQLWWHIALPTSSNTVAGVTILSFVLFWGNFTDPLLYLRSEAQMTWPVGLRLLAQLDATRWPVIMAGAVMLTLPVVLVFWHGSKSLKDCFTNYQLQISEIGIRDSEFGVRDSGFGIRNSGFETKGFGILTFGMERAR